MTLPNLDPTEIHHNPDKPFDKRIKPSNNLLRNLSLERPKETPILEKPNQIQSLERNQKNQFLRKDH